VSNSRQGQNADAFDDLLGQLVDELAMTPTMPEEPEPPVGPAPVPGGTVMAAAPMAPHDAAAMGGQAAYYQPPPQKSSSVGLALGIGGGIVVLGSVIAGMVLLREPDKPAEDKTPTSAQTDVKAPETKTETKTDVPPPAPGVVATPGQPGQPLPGQPGQPGVVPPGQPGQPLPGQPGQPGVVTPGQPGQPGVVTPGTDPAATPAPPAAPAKKKKRAPKKKKGGGTFDPFAM